MPIKFSCPHCKKVLQLKEQFAGKRGACPACKKLITVPAQTSSAPAAAKASADLEALAAAALTAGQQEAAAATPATVDFTCPQCDAELHISAELAGKQTPCPECRRIIKVPLLQKAGPRDWRQPETQLGPSGARRPPNTLDGSWGSTTSTSGVSRQSLVEAAVIKEQREPLTLRQWLVRGTGVAAVLCLLIAGTMWWLNFRAGRVEQRAVALAEKYLSEDAIARLQPASLQPVVQAELQRLLGEYYLRTLGEADPRKGVQCLQMARQAAAKISDLGDRHAVLRALLRIHAPRAADPELALEMAETLKLAPPGAFRFDLVRELTRRAVLGGPRDSQEVSRRAGQVDQILIQGIPDEVERLSCRSILCQELVTGHVSLAQQQSETLQKALGKDQQPPKHWLVLLVMLDKPGADAAKDKELVHFAQVEGLARAGKLDAARQRLDGQPQNPTLSRADALLACAEVLIEHGQNDEAIRRLAEAVKIAEIFREPTVWQRQRCVELALAAGRRDEAERWVASGLFEGPGQGWAQLAVLKADLGQQMDQAIDPGRVQSLLPAGGSPTAPFAVGCALVARHNARQDAKSASAWAHALEPEMGRPFAAIGVALGLHDQR
jgi:DNA-directed RNA polymerase subunit M/transcription elongation factor TFIIS